MIIDLTPTDINDLIDILNQDDKISKYIRKFVVERMVLKLKEALLAENKKQELTTKPAFEVYKYGYECGMKDAQKLQEKMTEWCGEQTEKQHCHLRHTKEVTACFGKYVECLDCGKMLHRLY